MIDRRCSMSLVSADDGQGAETAVPWRAGRSCEYSGNGKIERKLRDDRGFAIIVIADDIRCVSGMLNAEFHGAPLK
jgi:hypothetical protein